MLECMRAVLLLSILLVVAATADANSDSSESTEAFAGLFTGEPVVCPDGVPEACICAEISIQVDLPTRYSRVQSCPHPVLDEVRNLRTFTADGAIVDDLMMKGGQLHGAAISWHPNGQVEGIANFDQGRQIGFARAWHDNGVLFAEQQFKDGQSHGLEIRQSRSGEVERVIVWDHGQVDREETLRLSRKLGIESP